MSKGTSESLSALDARRIVLGAQGFGSPGTPSGRNSRAGVAALRKLGQRLLIFQIDPINVLVRSQYLPAFSRLGPYPMERLDQLAYSEFGMFEYVGHEWSLVTVDLHPLLRFRMAAFAGDPRWTYNLPRGYIDQVIAEVTERGPLAPSELSEPGKRGDRFEAMPGKRVLHWLTQSGVITVAGRRGLHQIYDLTGRVLPAGILAAPTPSPDDSRRELLMNSAKALGIGTAKDIVSYFLLGLGVAGFSERVVYPKCTTAAKLVAGLAAEGRLREVRVEGWKDKAYLHPDAPEAAKMDVNAFLSPFDSLIWERDRTERLFGFRYRSEIYVPAAKRQYGYYVLPILIGGSIVARVDLKADRKQNVMSMIGAFSEEDVDIDNIVEPIAAELKRLAEWLGLNGVEVGDRGDLAEPLHLAFARA